MPQVPVFGTWVLGSLTGPHRVHKNPAQKKRAGSWHRPSHSSNWLRGSDLNSRPSGYELYRKEGQKSHKCLLWHCLAPNSPN